ncbi:MAG: hypothetical protein PVF58_02270 [Candidatus Methanofastidiosia archaeon]|jgi:hypothetical protein
MDEEKKEDEKSSFHSEKRMIGRIRENRSNLVSDRKEKVAK